MKRHIIYPAIALLAASAAFTSCSDDDLDSTSIFDTVDESLDPNSYTYKFDRWLEESFKKPYNMDFQYKMQHLATDMDYNLVPATLDKAQKLAVLTKYLWYDVYDVRVGQDFLRRYGPKMIHLIGSSAVNPVNGTEILGLAEGGLKVSLFKVNSLDVDDTEQLNEKFFKTMHHEFAHILHQTKTYPKEFEQINAADYEPMRWQDRSGGAMASLGFTTPYASSQGREDFAETIANYITRTDDQWDLTLWLAQHDWVTGEYNDKDVAYAFYYYANAADQENDVKTYVCCFQEVEQVFSVTNGTGKIDGEGNFLSDPNLGNRMYKTVAEVEAFIADLRKQHDLFPAPSTDGKDGYAIINQKLNIAREWLQTSYGIDLDALRAEVQYRQSHIDIEALLAEIDQMK